jgi:hypothetical protein
MKKLLYIIGFLMFSTAVVQPIIAYGQETEPFSASDEGIPYSTGRLFSRVTEEAGLDPNEDWTQTFGTTDEDEVGKNLYFKVWDKVQNQPIKDATRNISGHYGMTQSELVMILQNDYTTILERKPNITQEEAQEKVAEIQQKYKEEKEILTLQASIRSSVEASEMFANDDLSDSGFDLIHDLRIIEELLFLHTEPVEVGGTWFPEFGGGGGGGGAQAEEEAAGAEAGAEAGVTGAGEAAGIPTETGAGAAATGAAAGTTAAGAGTAAGTGVPGAAEGAINPNSCFDDNQYADAFADFENITGTDPNFIDRAGATGPTAGVPSMGVPGTGPGGLFIPIGAGTPSAAAPSAEGADFFPDLTEGQEVPAVQPAEAGDWTKVLPCNDIYCLTINFVMEPMRSRYQDPDNCIACHAEKINDVLQEVINHSLVPTKAPGNLGESAECKKAMADASGNINMNLYAVAMPVRTPINDDLIWGTSLEEEWYNFCSQVAFYPFDECKEPGDSEKPVSQFETKPSFTDNYGQRVLTMAADGTDQETIIEEIERGVQMKADEVQKSGATVALEETNDLTLVARDPLLTEMDQMNYYFENIRDILQSLHTPVADLPGPQACTNLKNKTECE